MKCGELPQVMSLESASFGSEDCKLGKKKKSGGVKLQGSELTRPLHLCSRLEATVAATSVIHLDLSLNCRQLHCG